MRLASSAFVIVCLGLSQGCSGPSPVARWFYTCGDPVCSGYRAPAGVPPCGSGETAGQACGNEGASCDPHDGCNRLLACATADPTQRPGGCPISRAAAKRDIRYLGPAEIERRYAELRALRLATYRYREAGPASAERLGFIIDDRPPAVCVNGSGETVDLYGFTSLAVAAVQAQAARIDGLEREIAELRARLATEGERAPLGRRARAPAGKG